MSIRTIARTCTNFSADGKRRQNLLKLSCTTKEIDREEPEKASMEKSKDQDRGKGAMEQDQEKHGGNTSMQGQLGHRDEDVELKDADSNLAG